MTQQDYSCGSVLYLVYLYFKFIVMCHIIIYASHNYIIRYEIHYALLAYELAPYHFSIAYDLDIAITYAYPFLYVLHYWDVLV